MSDLTSLSEKVRKWLALGEDGESVCGEDLEYDNEFLELNQHAAGKPETQFSAAEPPDWRAAFEVGERLMDRSRDLRTAIFWLRAGTHLHGIAFVPVGFGLIAGMLESHWEHLHPLPDPEDGDPYARVNALSQLTDLDGFINDLRAIRVVSDRTIGELTIKSIEESLGLLPARADDPAPSREQVSMMLAAAVEKTPDLSVWIRESAQEAARLSSVVNEKLGSGVAPDLRVIGKVISSVVSVLPSESVEGMVDSSREESSSIENANGLRIPQQGLSGQISSRDDAVKAIDMICLYLERTEPTNPAPLFLRRARHLIGHNFLQLMKELAPDALAEVARVVGVDPDSVEMPGS